MAARMIYEHPLVVRFTHWANAVSLTILTMSGLQIFMAFPSFGPKIPQSDLLYVPEMARLGGWLGGALQWHYTFAWLFSITGVTYVMYHVLSGHWRRQTYNPLQRLAYASTVALGVIAVATGLLLARPIQLSGIVTALGGFGVVRILHFGAMVGFLVFVPGHVLMVALHGWANFASMWTGWKAGHQHLAD